MSNRFPENSGNGFRPTFDSAARNVADWLHASEDAVLKLVKIDLDQIDTVIISSEVNSDDTESTDPLQF